jgi:hypothetical protein
VGYLKRTGLILVGVILALGSLYLLLSVAFPMHLYGNVVALDGSDGILKRATSAMAQMATVMINAPVKWSLSAIAPSVPSSGGKTSAMHRAHSSRVESKEW